MRSYLGFAGMDALPRPPGIHEATRTYPQKSGQHLYSSRLCTIGFQFGGSFIRSDMGQTL